MASTPLRLDDTQVHAPLPLIKPTRANFKHVEPSKEAAESERPEAASAVRFRWSSRNNRKGRHAIAVPPEDARGGAYDVPAYSTTFTVIRRNIWRMLTYYPVWDVSWLVAYVFTLGSVVWVINSFFVFLPALQNINNAEQLILYGGGITAFIGASIFEIGSVLLILEAFNTNQGGCFGWALEKVFDKEVEVIRAAPHECSHHHPVKNNLVAKSDGSPDSWTWWPSEDAFKQGYSHDLGFIASVAQMIGATIFWVSGFTALPGIYNILTPGETTGVFWVPQIVGGSFFIISGLLFMIETQKKWYIPEFGVLGWHIGFFNTIGGVGFTLCPAFGLYPAAWAQYQSSCSTFWGSWAFLIGSTIQWYESLDKYPVERG